MGKKWVCLFLVRRAAGSRGPAPGLPRAPGDRVRPQQRGRALLPGQEDGDSRLESPRQHRFALGRAAGEAELPRHRQPAPLGLQGEGRGLREPGGEARVAKETKKKYSIFNKKNFKKYAANVSWPTPTNRIEAVLAATARARTEIPFCLVLPCVRFFFTAAFRRRKGNGRLFESLMLPYTESNQQQQAI